MPAATQAVYDGEKLPCKQVIILRFGAAAGSEAYDEPLTNLPVNIANIYCVISIYPA
jgi:hypothetical protein